VRAILSFNPCDVGLAEAFRATLFVYAPDIEVFFSPRVYEEHRSLSIERADAIVLFVGPQGLGEIQAQQLWRVQKRQQRSSKFKVLPIIAAGGKVPSSLGSVLTWISAPIVTDANVARRVAAVLLDKGGEHALMDGSAAPSWHSQPRLDP
jgi:hypothetical protein